MNYKPSSDLHRAAELAARNEERRAAWQEKYASRVADALRRVGCGTATVDDADLLSAAYEEATCARFSTL
jgi:hypothetical protein